MPGARPERSETVAARTKKAAKAGAQTEAASAEVFTSYKAFDKDFSCRGHKFEIGKTYTVTGAVQVCGNGFHACPDSPMDVWEYYPVLENDGSFTRYGLVEQGGATDRQDTKLASASITVKAEIAFPDFVRKAVAAVIEKCRGSGSDTASSGYYARLASSGYYARLVAEGPHSVLVGGSPGIMARGPVGTQISLASFRGGKCIGFASGRVGDDDLKSDTFYRADGLKLVEAA